MLAHDIHPYKERDEIRDFCRFQLDPSTVWKLELHEGSFVACVCPLVVCELVTAANNGRLPFQNGVQVTPLVQTCDGTCRTQI